ncbi:unnamed protein product [Pleuronectes platessa]|uniref:Uncharacterized protein n=1 Tax=Pleuronectes platessa TaxID=8262 RepID=A0A9N7ULA2_PLEPL|nr:unnamed protein product [Pleuronectes platessa]
MDACTGDAARGRYRPRGNRANSELQSNREKCAIEKNPKTKPLSHQIGGFLEKLVFELPAFLQRGQTVAVAFKLIQRQGQGVSHLCSFATAPPYNIYGAARGCSPTGSLSPKSERAAGARGHNSRLLHFLLGEVDRQEEQAAPSARPGALHEDIIFPRTSRKRTTSVGLGHVRCSAKNAVTLWSSVRGAVSDSQSARDQQLHSPAETKRRSGAERRSRGNKRRVEALRAAGRSSPLSRCSRIPPADRAHGYTRMDAAGDRGEAGGRIKRLKPGFVSEPRRVGDGGWRHQGSATPSADRSPVSSRSSSSSMRRRRHLVVQVAPRGDTGAPQADVPHTLISLNL